ncbi:MAG: GntR family transcriptional regulator [Spirochaetes bacterium]|nr:GntR family transcriptional regulator [Spirochaetota bacterium]
MSTTMRIARSPLLVDQIIERLQELIIRGDLPPAARLAEVKLSRRLETSRTPLREALFTLEQMGFVARRKNGGWVVSPRDIDKILERFEIKVMMEVYALLRSTRAGRAQFLRAADLLLPSMKKAMASMDYPAYRKLDLDFHSAFLLMYENGHHARMYGETIKHIQWVRGMAISPQLGMQDSFQDHTNIIAAIRKDDVHAASDELIRHLDRLITKVREDLETGKRRKAVAERVERSRENVRLARKRKSPSRRQT